MATYNSPLVTAKAPALTHGLAGNAKIMTTTVTCSAAPSTSDTINFFDLPANARVHMAMLTASDMDTNGSPTLTLNVGDSGDADRLFAASTVAQAGTASTALAATGAGNLYSSKTRITGTAANNAATGAAGTVTLSVVFTVEG